MQTTLRDQPKLAVSKRSHLVALTSEGVGGLLLVVGGPILAGRLEGALFGVLLAVVLLAALIVVAWRFGIECERAWMRSYSLPMVGEDLAGDAPGARVRRPLGPAISVRRSSEYVGASRTRTPAR